LTQQRKPTATGLLKTLHYSWLLRSSSSKANDGDDGGDDSDDGEPTDVALTTPVGFTKAFGKKFFKCGTKGHMAKDSLQSSGSNNNNGSGGGNGQGQRWRWLQRGLQLL